MGTYRCKDTLSDKKAPGWFERRNDMEEIIDPPPQDKVVSAEHGPGREKKREGQAMDSKTVWISKQVKGRSLRTT